MILIQAGEEETFIMVIDPIDPITDRLKSDPPEDRVDGRRVWGDL